MSQVAKLCEHGYFEPHGFSPYGTPSVHRPATCPGGQCLGPLTLVGLLIGDDEFIPQDIVEEHYPFAVPEGVQVRAVFVLVGHQELEAM